VRATHRPLHELGVAILVKTHFEIASPDCVAENFDGEIVAINLNTGRYFSLQGLGGAVWRDLIAGHAIEDVRRSLTDVDGNLGESLDRFVQALIESALLRPTGHNGASPPAMESTITLRTGVTMLAVEAYDDMKELLLTDPIHEVDEGIGWPVRRQAD
jgi:hypothetical protein